MESLESQDAAELAEPFPELAAKEENARKKAMQTRHLEFAYESLAELLRKTIKDEMELSTMKYNGEVDKTPELAAELQKRVGTYSNLV